MENLKKIDSYLNEIGIGYKKVDDIWVVNDEGFTNKLAIYIDDSIVVFRVKVTDLPKSNNEELYKKLLELNAYDLVHGAYAIEDNNIVIVDTLQVENLDLNEFRASFESIELSLAQHKSILEKYL
ncbi:MAG: YbjN domain-containing protein [Clostridium sp.]|uniref:YbjN domain-containing protein n=1 Tax=Clostridium TaxID=1485 RepID=UPI0021538CF4|nr:YbjN domain-containing protein [Clostridium sp. LY3-2]MCR6516196.1 YbjN domain-containing protein [Clostridium sp. LY3-2]